MHLINIVALAFAITATATPISTDFNATLTERADRGSYTVSGLGSRKEAILAAGGNSLDIAIAMLETERMSTDYTYGKISFPHPEWECNSLVKNSIVYERTMFAHERSFAFKSFL